MRSRLSARYCVLGLDITGFGASERRSDLTTSRILVDSAGLGTQFAMILRLLGAPVVSWLSTVRTTALRVR